MKEPDFIAQGDEDVSAWTRNFIALITLNAGGAAKNAVKEALMHGERSVTKAYIARNPAVNDAQKEALGVPAYDETRAPIPEPTTRPEFGFKAVCLMPIRIDFRDQGSARRAVPCGYNGAACCYATADAAVSGYAALIKSVLLTHSPRTLPLPPDAEGKGRRPAR
jgi:hypothetical protein